jgi:hypothetical protein
MRQISLPLPRLDDDDLIEFEVKSGKRGDLIRFKLEPVLWEDEEDKLNEKDDAKITFQRISRLKNSIESYDKTWELIQIFAPLKNSKYVKILYRKIL